MKLRLLAALLLSAVTAFAQETKPAEKKEPEKPDPVPANFVRKHTKANPQKNIKGGILEREAPVDLSNLMPVCGECGKPARVGHKLLDDGKKVRTCRRCGGILDK